MIEQILKSIPDSEINQKHFVLFYLYGSNISLENLKNHISKVCLDVHCSDVENGICIHEICLMNREDLQQRHDFYQHMAEMFSLEYDGFEVELQNSHYGESEQLNEFNNFFNPGDVFCWKTADRKYIFGVYYGGKYSDLGCFFNIYNKIFDSENISNEDLDKVGFLYRNPVLLKINSEKVNRINGINKYSEQSCFFRMEVGVQSLDYFYENDLVRPDGTEDDYLDLLLSMYQEGKFLDIKNWNLFEYELKGGDVTVIELSEEDSSKIKNSSYCFGVFGDMTMVESRLKGENRDLVFLSDEVFKRQT